MTLVEWLAVEHHRPTSREAIIAERVWQAATATQRERDAQIAENSPYGNKKFIAAAIRKGDAPQSEKLPSGNAD